MKASALSREIILVIAYKGKYIYRTFCPRMSPPCKLRAWRQSQKGLTPSLKTPLCQSLRPLSIETPGVEGIGENDTRKQPSMAAQVLPAYELI